MKELVLNNEIDVEEGPEAVLVLASGRVDDSLVSELGAVLTADIPIDGGCALDRVVDRLPATLPKFIYSGNYDAEAQAAFQQSAPATTFIEGDSRCSVSEALATTLAALPKNMSHVHVVFADTYHPAPGAPDAISVGAVRDTSRWTCVLRATDGPLEFIEKMVTHHGFGHEAVTGYFSISQAQVFLQILRSNLQETSNVPAIWRTWEAYDEAIGRGVILEEAPTWLDFGHLDTFYDSRRMLLGTREFNEMRIGRRPWILQKHSTDITKLEQEKEWFRGCPRKLLDWCPEVLLESQIDELPGRYTIQAVPAISLAEALVFSKLDEAWWVSALDELAKFIGELHSYEAPREIKRRSVDLRSEMYHSKVDERITHGLRPDVRILLDELEQAPHPEVLPLSDALVTYHALVDEHVLERAVDFSVIHGDLFLGNLMFDRRLQRLYAIDPRGAFGDAGIWGDPLYDLAKLRHSVKGLYDFISHGRFRICDDEGLPSTVIVTTKHSRSILELLDDWYGGVVESSRQDPLACAVVEAGLFLSLAALHQEDKRRQLAFLLRGLELITKLAGRPCS